MCRRRPDACGPACGRIRALLAAAMDGVRFGETWDERREAVARIVRRRQRMSLRVREDREAYPVRSGNGEAPGHP